eukprot:SAG31_NODE_7251_length_1742_cov_1.562386_2_plen_139_part_00
MGTKAIMVEFRLPLQWWAKAMESCRQCKNLWPMERSVKAIDGDGPGAWEIATDGKVSHGEVLKSISRFVPVGTLAMLGNTNILGSNIECGIRQTFAVGNPLAPLLLQWMMPTRRPTRERMRVGGKQNAADTMVAFWYR